jgi:hypothetical protein
MDTITQIPIEQLHESTANPRRTYSGIDELAASIRAEGRIHEPLLVRPRITNVLRPDEHDGFELVFGHRRLRAAEEAGLATVPCMVRAMSDVEAASARAAENLQHDGQGPHARAQHESGRAAGPRGHRHAHHGHRCQRAGPVRRSRPADWREPSARAIGRIQHMPAADVHQAANSYFGLLRQASHSHAERAALANAVRRRGHCVDGALTKAYRRHAT